MFFILPTKFFLLFFKKSPTFFYFLDIDIAKNELTPYYIYKGILYKDSDGVVVHDVLRLSAVDFTNQMLSSYSTYIGIDTTSKVNTSDVGVMTAATTRIATMA